MTAVPIPTSSDENDPFYSQNTTLDGVTYQLTFQYNQRNDCWHLHVYTEEGDPIYIGVRIVCSFPLLRRCADPRAPAGEIMCISGSSDLSDPGLNDLVPGGRCTLVYVPASDIP